MAGAGIRVTVEGEAEIEDRLKLLADRFGDLQPLMETIGMHLEVDAQDNFAGEHSPDGVRWQPSQRVRKSAVGASGPQRPSLKTLQDSRRLYLSITHRATARQVEVGTNVIYAARHQFGFEGTEKVASHKRTMRVAFGVRLAEPIEVIVGSFSRKAKTPARPFLGMSRSAAADITDAVETYVGGAA